MIEDKLNEKVLQQVSIANALGVEFNVEKRQPDIILVGNPKTKKVAVMGTTDIDGQELLVAYLLNVKKWTWADDEGFSKDEIVEHFSKEIFTWISIDTVAEELMS